MRYPTISGLVQYLSNFMPEITTYMLHLRNNRLFLWTPLLEGFESIKALALSPADLKPIDMTHPDTLWVLCDGSKFWSRCIYGQGPAWPKNLSPRRVPVQEVLCCTGRILDS